MSPDAPYTVAVAPHADEQIKAASAWWRPNSGRPDILRDDVGATLLLLSERPEIGRRVRTRRLGTLRLLVLRRMAVTRSGSPRAS